MEHLVESHLGGYYICDLEPKIITAYCESCGDSDYILSSWKEGNMIKALIQYFSLIKHSKENIEKELQAGITKQEAIESALFEYSYNDRNIIDNLFEEKNISEEEYRMLLKENLKAQKSQIEIICKVYPKEDRVALKIKKRFNNNQSF